MCFVLRRYSFSEAHWYAVRTPVWWKQGNTALGESLTREAENNGQFVPKKEINDIYFKIPFSKPCRRGGEQGIIVPA